MTAKLSNSYKKFPFGVFFPIQLFIQPETQRTDIVKDTLFIQFLRFFYGQTGSGWFDLSNGFSDTWNLYSSKETPLQGYKNLNKVTSPGRTQS
jgi:hypothetical protein